MLYPFRCTDAFTWLAGAELQLLRHAYPDRSRFVSLGFSVAVAALVAATAGGLGISLVAWSWLGWLSFPLLLVSIGFALRRSLYWVWAGAPTQFQRRLTLLTLLLTSNAILLGWPIQHYLFGPVAGHSLTATQLLNWAVRLTVLLIFLVPAYVASISGNGSYAQALSARHAFYAKFRY